MANYRISFQLYSARNFPPLEAQLESLAAIGYDAVEPYAGNFKDDVKGFRAKTDALGLAIPTAHMPLADLDADRAKFIDTARTLGVETAILPYIAPELRPTTAEGWKAFAARIGEHAAYLAEAGVKLGWHNHEFEYARLPDGTRPIDLLLAVNGLKAEIDIGWVVRAGVDPAAEIRKEAAKIAAFHVKDTVDTGGNPRPTMKDDGWTDVGAGIIDWKAMWPAIAATGATLLVVEHDNPSDWRAFAANSHKYLNGLTGRG
jgi:sugar phosphate isomerase/epimerase